jgi:hypothetical protein
MEVKANLTKEVEHLRSYVRRITYIPVDDPRYKSGRSIEHRVEPPLDEIPGDCFDRQRVIEGFSQGEVEKQRCLILGMADSTILLALILFI